MAPHYRQVLRIVCEGTTEGTGYTISDHLVLTALHVVLADAPMVKIPGVEALVPAAVVWRSESLDLALLETAPSHPLPCPQTVRWGAIRSRTADLRVEFAGFPILMINREGMDDFSHSTGLVDPATGREQHRIHVRLSRDLPRIGSHNPWNGNSGAPVLATSALVGIVLDAHHSDRLIAAPVTAALDDPQFRRIVEQKVGTIDVTTVDLADLFRFARAEAQGSVTELLARADDDDLWFPGLEQQYADLVSWAREPGLAVRLVWGPAGSGKTSMAAKVTRDLRYDGWAADFVDLREPDSDGLRRLAEMDAATILVVDYAEQHPGAVTRLLAAMRKNTDEFPIKLVLLARSDGQWWRTMKTMSAELSSVSVDSYPIGPLVIPSTVRTATFVQTVAEFAGRLGRSSSFSEVNWWDRAQRAKAPPSDDELWSSPLGVRVAALIALVDSDGPSKPTELPVVYRLFEHEDRYWARAAAGRGLNEYTDMLPEIACTATLYGASTEREANTVMALRFEDIPRFDRVRLSIFVHEMHGHSHHAWWSSASPSLVDEHRLIRGGPTLQRIVSALPHVSHDQAVRALTILMRTASREPKLWEILEDLLRMHNQSVPLPLVAGVALAVAPVQMAEVIRRAYPRRVENDELIVQALDHPGSARGRDLLYAAYRRAHEDPRVELFNLASRAAELVGELRNVLKSAGGQQTELAHREDKLHDVWYHLARAIAALTNEMASIQRGVASGDLRGPQLAMESILGLAGAVERDLGDAARIGQAIAHGTEVLLRTSKKLELLLADFSRMAAAATDAASRLNITILD